MAERIAAGFDPSLEEARPGDEFTFELPEDLPREAVTALQERYRKAGWREIRWSRYRDKRQYLVLIR